jgi:DNA-binding NarL/FixJ family response regulator
MTAEKQKHRILIADDHPLFRDGLAQMLRQLSFLDLVAEVGDGQEVLAAVEQTQPDLAILDVDMPGLNGLELAQQLRKRDPAPLVILLTMHKNERIFNEALDLGVDHSILKDETVNGVRRAIQCALAGEPYLSPMLSRLILRRRERMSILLDEHAGLASLTSTEIVVIKHIAKDHSNKEISAEMGISPRTVGTHRTNISRKLGLRGPHALIHFALDNKSELLRLPG